MSLSRLTGSALSALTEVAYSTYLSPRAFLCFRKNAFWICVFPRKLATEFCVSTKEAIQNFVFPPKCETGLCVPVNVFKCTEPRYVSGVSPS